MKTYKAILFALDGDWVTDYFGKTKDEVLEKLASRGSRWFFYPLEGIILDKGIATTSKQRVIFMNSLSLRFLSGKSIKSVCKWLKDNEKDVGGLPGG